MMTTPALCPCVRCGEVGVEVKGGALAVVSGACAPGCTLPLKSDVEHVFVRTKYSPGKANELEPIDFETEGAAFKTHCVPKQLHCE